MFNEFGVLCAYTCEASLSGADGRHFRTSDLTTMGREFCSSLVEFSKQLSSMQPEVNEENRVCYRSLTTSNSQENQSKDEDKMASSVLSGELCDSAGSDSNPSEDNMDEKEALSLLRACLGETKSIKRKPQANSGI